MCACKCNVMKTKRNKTKKEEPNYELLRIVRRPAEAEREESPRRPPPTLPAGKTGSGSSQERQPKRKTQAEANGWAAIHKRR